MGIDAQAPLETLNTTINTQQQEEQMNDPLNTGMIMGPREMLENGIGQQQDNLQGNLQQENLQQNDLQLSLQRTEQVMRQQDGIQAPQTSQSLERAAEVSFEKGIHSRKGSCDKRNTTRKKARVRKRLNNAAGLTEHSGVLAEQLKGNIERDAERKEEGSKHFDRWASSGAGQETLKYTDPESIDNMKDIMVKVGDYLKSDTSRIALMSSDPICRAAGIEELMDNAMKFELQPNACCTVSAIERGAQVLEHGNLVGMVDQLLGGMSEKVKNKLPESKITQYRKYSRVFHLLDNSTAATIKLQGLNEDGSNKYKFEENSTLTQRISLSRERSYLKKFQRSDSSKYERELESYRSNTKSAEEQEKERLADIKKITGVDMSVQSFELMRKIMANEEGGFEAHENESRRIGKWRATPVGKEVSKAFEETRKKSDSKKTEQEKAYTTLEISTLHTNLSGYLPHNPESENALYGNDPQLRAIETDKIISKVKDKFDAIDFKADANYYMNPANFDEYRQLKELAPDIESLKFLLEQDTYAAKHIDGAKIEAVNSMYSLSDALHGFMDNALRLNHIAIGGGVRLVEPEKEVKGEEYVAKDNIKKLEAEMQKLSQRVAETSTPEEQAKLNAELAALTTQWEASTSELQQMENTRDERMATFAEKDMQKLVTARDQFEATYLKMREPIAAEKKEKELAKEKLEQEKLEKEKELEKEKLEKEKLEKEKLAKEKQEQEDIAWEHALREKLEKEYNGKYPEEKVTEAKKERSDFIRRKDMSPQDAKKDMAADSQKWIANWTESDEGKEYKKDQFALGGSRVMTREQTADATILSHLLTDAQRKNLFSTGSSKRAAAGRELYHIIMGDTEIKKNAPQEERDKVKVQQDVAKLSSNRNAKALLRLAREEKYSFLTERQVQEMIKFLQK